MKTRKVFKWWGGWNPEKIELWLEKKAEEGWVLQSTSWNMLIFHFIKGAPARTVFGADFHPNPTPAYKKRAISDNWKLINEGYGWFLWCKTYRDSDEELEFLIDKTTRLSRMKKLFGFIIPAVATQLALLPIVSRYLFNGNIFVDIISGIYSAIALFLLYAVTRIFFKLTSIYKEEE